MGTIGRSRGLAAFILFAWAWASPGQAQSIAGRVEVEVARPLTLVNSAPLSFGTIAAGIGGTAIVDPDTQAVTTSGGVVALGGPVSAAEFSGIAGAGKHVKVSLPKGGILLKRVGGTETMTLRAFTIDGKRNEREVINNAFSFRVGGTLTVGTGQAEGLYQGSFDIIVDNF